MREQKDEPKSARETFGRRFKLTRAKHMPHPAPVKGGHYKSTPQMERPHYEELETPMSNKTFREALRDFEAIAEGRQPAEAPHMIVQLEKHVRNPEMNPLRFKNGQKAKIPEAMAHKAMKMHDSMNQRDKQAFVAHISKSIEHLKSGLKGEWKKATKKSISLAGPKLRKEEVEQVDETSQAKKDRYVERSASQASMANFTKRHATGKTKEDAENIERKRKAGLRMALKSKMDEEVEQIDEEWGSSKIAMGIRGTRASMAKMSSIKTTPLRGKQRKPKVQNLDVKKLSEEQLEIYKALSDEGKVLFEKMSSEQLAKMVAVFHAKGGKIKRGKTPKRKESEKTWPASKMKGSKWASTAGSINRKNQGYKK